MIVRIYNVYYTLYCPRWGWTWAVEDVACWHLDLEIAPMRRALSAQGSDRGGQGVPWRTSWNRLKVTNIIWRVSAILYLISVRYKDPDESEFVKIGCYSKVRHPRVRLEWGRGWGGQTLEQPDSCWRIFLLQTLWESWRVLLQDFWDQFSSQHIQYHWAQAGDWKACVNGEFAKQMWLL